MSKLSLHEKLELHEILTMKSNALTKATTMKALVGCEDLKAILSMDVVTNKEHIKQLQSFLQIGGE